MLMRAGVSYSDWRQMAPFQRNDYLARHFLHMREVAQEAAKADSLAGVLSLVVRKLLGF